MDIERQLAISALYLTVSPCLETSYIGIKDICIRIVSTALFETSNIRNNSKIFKYLDKLIMVCQYNVIMLCVHGYSTWLSEKATWKRERRA